MQEEMHLNDPNAFIECFKTMDDVHETIDVYKSNRKKNDYVRDMIAAIMTNKKFQALIK